MEKKFYQKKEVSEKLAGLGITPRLVQFYTEAGLISPEVSNPGGKGSTRIYSAENLADLVIAKRLSESGLALASIPKVFEVFKQSGFRRKYFRPGHKALVIYDPNAEGMKIIPVFSMTAEAMATVVKKEVFEVESPAVKIGLGGFGAVLILNLNPILEAIAKL